MDDVLASFLASPDEARSEQQLGDVLAHHATPLVRRIVSRRLGASSIDVDDVCSQVIMQLLLRLRRERTASEPGIESFAAYVASAAHHGCDHFIRAKYPLRWRLRSRLRHVLEHDGHFALWRAIDGGLLCGHAEWRSRQTPGAIPAAGQLAGIGQDNARGLLARLFDLAGGPVEFSAVVDVAADAWGIPLLPRDASHPLETVADVQLRADDLLQQRGRLALVWAQICDLPLRQRQALLLNLKEDGLTTFITTGAASLRDIAAALELSVDALAALWNDLPLPDNALALRLGSPRQQVINLRMSARKRLANRLRSTANIAGTKAL
jgi:hypothetical protein